MKLENPDGAVRISLLRPLANAKNDTPSSASAFTNKSSLPYCDGYNGTRPAKYRLPCQFVGEVDVEEAFQDNLFVATRVKEAVETRACESRVHCTHLFRSKNQSAYFVADVERFTVLVDHSFYTPSIGVSESSRYMHGGLIAPSASALCTGRPTISGTHTCSVPTNHTHTGNLDVLDLGSLLQAAETDLDTVEENASRSLRADGVVLLLYIEYSNFDHWSGPRAPSYKYIVKRLKGGTSKASSVAYTHYPNTRTQRSARGLRIVVLFTGELGVFRPEVLLLQFTASLTLFAVATLIVDFVAVRWLPERRDYRKAKYQVTHELHDIKDGKFDDDSIFEHSSVSSASFLNDHRA